MQSRAERDITGWCAQDWITATLITISTERDVCRPLRIIWPGHTGLTRSSYSYTWADRLGNTSVRCTSIRVLYRYVWWNIQLYHISYTIYNISLRYWTFGPIYIAWLCRYKLLRGPDVDYNLLRSQQPTYLHRRRCMTRDHCPDLSGRSNNAEDVASTIQNQPAPGAGARRRLPC